MVQFYREIDLSDRNAMIDFLSNHFRYDTANGWNRSTSYANNMKVYNLGLSDEQESALLDMMYCDGIYDSINDFIYDFGDKYSWKWQAGFNGRSGGYLVLYAGGSKESEYKSFCKYCGQRNYTSVKETGCRCGHCGRNGHVDFPSAPMETFTCIGKSVDMDEDFEDWDEEQLRERVKLVQDFDRLCDDIVAETAYLADNAHVEEVEVMVPKTVKRLVLAKFAWAESNTLETNESAGR